MIAHLKETENKPKLKTVHFMDLHVGCMITDVHCCSRLKISESQYLLRVCSGYIQAQSKEDWCPSGVTGEIQKVKMIWEIQ